jgi:hypothetical protein
MGGHDDSLDTSEPCEEHHPEGPGEVSHARAKRRPTVRTLLTCISDVKAYELVRPGSGRQDAQIGEQKRDVSCKRNVRELFGCCVE